MPYRARFRDAPLLAATLLGSAGGCLLLAPLDDYPAARTTSSAGEGGAPPAASGGQGGDGDQEPVAGQPSSGAHECETNADCVARGGDEPYRCRPSDHSCQPVKSDICPVVHGAYAEPGAIFFGAFATLDAVTPADNAIVLAQDLALEELSGDNVGGLPGGPADTRRPLVMVVCDNRDEVVDEALRHLVEDLEVPAVLATLKPGDLRRGFEAHRASDVFYLSPVSVTKTVVDEADDGLIWNLLGQPSDFTPAYAKLLERTEDYVRAAQGLADEDPIRVALVTTTDAFDSELAASILPALHFNGAPVSANEMNEHFQGFTLDSADPGIADTAQQLVTFRPHVVVSAASEVVTMPGGLLDEIETLWEITNIPGFDQPLPSYLLSPYNAGDLGHVSQLISLLAESTTEPNPEHRFFGLSVAAAEDRTLQNQYAARLRTRFEQAYTDTANYYDAVYFLAYAMYGAGTDAPLGGRGIARGMRRLLSGKSFTPGPHDITSVFSALSDPDASIALQSTLGPPSFDLQTGVRPIDASVFCFQRQQALVTLKLDVRRYDRALEDFRGSGSFCFSGLMP